MIWSLRKSLTILIGSVLITSLFGGGFLLLYKNWKSKRLSDDRYKVVSILQTGSEKEALKTVYLAEILQLSTDHPINLFAIDLKQAEMSLLSSPLISCANVKRIPPGTLYIDYEIRRPVAWLADYKNIGIDREGYLFPIAPFFSPKEMPEIYLGLPSFGDIADRYGREGGKWEVPLQNKFLDLAFDILQTFEGMAWKEGLRIKRIDVSNAFAPSLGRREIVLFTDEELVIKKENKELSFIFPKILRFSSKDYTSQLQNFFMLRKTMLDDYRRQLASADQGGKFLSRVVDLRISQLAFIENR